MEHLRRTARMFRLEHKRNEDLGEQLIITDKITDRIQMGQ